MSDISNIANLNHLPAQIVGNGEMLPAWRMALENTFEADRPQADTPALAEPGISSSIAADLKDKNFKSGALAVANGIGIGAVEVAGNLKVPPAASLMLAGLVSKHVGLPPGLEEVSSGAASFLVFGAWSYAAARTLNGGMNQLPKTFAAASRRISSPDVISEWFVLPGLQTATKKEKVRTHIGRGVFGCLALAPYMAAAGLQQQTQPERLQLAKKIAIDTGLFMGSVATAVATSVALLEPSHPETAESIQNIYTDMGLQMKVFLGFTLLRIASKWSAGKLRKKLEKIKSGRRPELALATETEA